MIRKYFPFDKNYILQEAQTASRDTLLSSLIDTVKNCYQAYYNPLGLVDDTVQKLIDFQPSDIEFLHEFYDDLAGIYRYKYGEVQLEFLWDGSSHHEKYRKEWEEAFLKWVRDFCHQSVFIRAIFELTVFYTPLTRPELVQTRLKHFASNYFDLKIYHYRGITDNLKIA